jgi:hypothetical protein
VKKKTRACPVCGLAFRAGQRVVLLGGGAVRSVVACQACARNGVTIVAPEIEARARELVAPFAIHLRKLAKGYRLNDEKIATGLEIAAGILESGRAPPSDGKSNGAGVLGSGLRGRPAVDAFQAAWQVDPVTKTIRGAPLPPARGDLDDELVVAAHAAARPKPAVKVRVDASGLTKIERAILTVLVQRAKPTSERQLVALTGYKYTGAFTGALADLRRAEFIQGPGRALTFTDLGQAELGGSVEPLPTGVALLEHWLGKLKKPIERRIVLRLSETVDGTLDEASLLEAICSKYTGSYTGAISKLRKLDLLEPRGAPRLTREFLEAVRP